MWGANIADIGTSCSDTHCALTYRHGDPAADIGSAHSYKHANTRADIYKAVTYEHVGTSSNLYDTSSDIDNSSYHNYSGPHKHAGTSANPARSSSLLLYALRVLRGNPSIPDGSRGREISFG